MEGVTQETESYIGNEKQEWFWHVKIYYAQTKTMLGKKRFVNIICLDFDSKL